MIRPNEAKKVTEEISFIDNRIKESAAIGLSHINLFKDQYLKYYDYLKRLGYKIDLGKKCRPSFYVSW